MTQENKDKEVKKWVVVGLLLSTSFFVYSASISGKIKDQKGVSIPFALVSIDNDSSKTTADINGKYAFEDVKEGTHLIKVFSFGFVVQQKSVKVGGKDVTTNFSLEESVNELDAVVIEGQSKKEILKKEPYAVSVIDIEPLKARDLDVNRVLNTSAGIRIRESGGLGSKFNFSLNGFSGRQVRFFLDGVPMDNFGSSLTLNNIPVNLISRVEVYKGVVPVHLGSDALGGAVNVVSDVSMRDFVDVAYSYGSFNTHRTSVISRFVNDSSGLVVNANAFFNYSDNDYEVEVEIADLKTGKYEEPEKVKRFHDAYQSQMVQIEAGVIRKKYADRLLLGVVASSNYKEVQTGINMTQVAGEISTEDKVIIPTLKYQKYDLFTKGLTLNVYANYNRRQALNIDTSSNIYDWHGDYRERGILATSGELTWYKTLFRFNDNSFLNTVNLSYELDSTHSFSINNVFSGYTRVGEDPITYGAVPFSEPNTLNKNVTGLSYNLSLLDNKLKTAVFGKMFLMKASTFEGTTVGEGRELININVSNKYEGYGLASAYHFSPSLQLKASFENTYRLPDAYEMFGDGLLLLSSVYLEAEKSKNFNVGLIKKLKIKKHEFLFEADYLYRLPRNLIRLSATGVTSEYQNLSSAKSTIYEGGVKYLYHKKVKIEVNATYQNILNKETQTASGGENYLYGDRLPNMPFLFGNASAGLIFKDRWIKGSVLSINWSALFVEAFYLKWPSQGYRDSKYDIPRQIAHTLSASYSVKEGKYNISLSCSNVFNKALFDNFMLQKPGRAFNVKLRYFLNRN